MTTIHNQPIPKEKMKQWHEILCATGGRYLSNPIDCGDVMRVSYAPGDYVKQSLAWNIVSTPIKEIRSDGLFKTLINRIKQYVF
jgi:hypothetical protein